MTTQEQLNEAYRCLIDLSAVYECLGRSDETDAVLRELDGPFLVADHEQYQNSTPRVVIVGQENHGWNGKYLDFIESRSPDDALAFMLQGYRDFDLERSYSTSFFQYFAAIRDAIRNGASDDNRRSVIWTNLFKFNHDGKSTLESPHLARILVLQKDVFQREIRALQPDAVIFLTGPNYDQIIRRFYPDVQTVPVDGHPTNEITQLKAAGLPELCFRTYHPNHFNRIKRKKPYCYEAVIARIRAS